MKKISSTIIFLISCHVLFAQINTTVNFNASQIQNNKTFGHSKNNFIIQPPSDESIFLQKNQKGENKKFIFGENIQTNISLADCKWFYIAKERVCSIKIESEGAKSLNIKLTNFHLSPTAEMFLYDEKGFMKAGPITAKENNAEEIFLSDIFPGNKLFIDIKEIAGGEKSNFIISRITYGLKDIYQNVFNAPTAGKCEQNITCFLGGWHDEAKSAIRLLISGNTLCSACLINNTAEDGTPYVLTANHCVSGIPHIEHDISFVFFYRSKFCDSTIPLNNYTTYNQAYVRAKYYKSDFALLEMRQKPVGEKYYYAGWSRDTGQGSFAACIHFPEGDLMKYSESVLPVVDTAYGTTLNRKTMYWIRWTGKGVTENGSSGGAIFNSSKQIIGELYDGPSYCGAKGNEKSDYFGGIYASWNGGGEVANSLKYWLDPLHTNASALNGMYINNVEANKKNNSAENTFGKNNIHLWPIPAHEILNIDIPEYATNDFTVLNIFSLNGKNLITKNLLTGNNKISLANIPSGVYFVRITGLQNSIIKKLVVTK